MYLYRQLFYIILLNIMAIIFIGIGYIKEDFTLIFYSLTCIISSNLLSILLFLKK